MINFYSPYAIIVYDNLKNNAEQISARLKDFLRFKTHGQIDIKVFETKNISQCLLEVAEQGYPWATVVTPGNFLQSQESFIQSIEHARTENSPLACHILDRGGYYHFHPQWFSIDLQVYKNIGCPSLEETPQPITIITRQTERCPDNAHDDYTPWWVRPCSDVETAYTSDYGYFGINLIAALIKHGYTVTNIPQSLRNRKNFCYPDHNAETIERLMDGSTEEIKDEALWWFVHNLTHLTANLKNGYYVLNTEQIIPEDHVLLQGRKFNTFMGVCGGLKPACITGADNWQPGSRVVLFDISPAAIKYQKYLIENWDGDLGNFEKVFRTFETGNRDLYPLYFGDKSIDENIQWFLGSANIDQETFYHRWQKYLDHHHEFIELDLLEDDAMNKIDRMIGGTSCHGYFWASNVFYMDYLMFYKGKTWSEQKTVDFINGLKQTLDKNSILELSNTLHLLD